MSISDVCGDTMPKAIIMAVGDTPLNSLRDLLKLNNISDAVINVDSNTHDEVVRLASSDEQSQCILIKGVRDLAQMLPKLSDCADNIVLLYCSPITALGNSLELSDGSIKPEHAVTLWQKSVSQAMELVEHNDSYLLCDLNDILGHQSSFLTSLFSIEQAVELKPSVYTKKLLANHLASIHLFEDDDAFALYDEALSIGRLFGDFTVHLGPDSDELKQSAIDSGQSVYQQFISHNQEMQTKAARIQELQRQLNDTEAKQVEIQTSLENITSKKNEVEQALSQMTKTHEERVKELESQLESLKNTKLAVEENISELNEQLGQSKTLTNQQSEKLVSLQQELESTNTKLKEATEDKEKIVAEYDKRIQQTQQHSANLEKEKQEIVNQLEEHKKLLQSEKQIKHELEQILSEAKHANEEKNEQLNKQVEALAEQNNQVTALKVKVAELQQAQENLHAEKEQVIKAKDKQQAEINACVEDNRRIAAEHEATIKQLEQANAECKQAVQDKKAIEDQYQNASQKLGEANKRLAELVLFQAKLESVIQQYELAELQIAQLQEELESTVIKMNGLSELPEKLEQAQATIQQYEVKIEELSSGKTLTEAQVAQLQEELEATLIELTKEKTLAKQLAEQTKNSERVVKDFNQLQSDKNAVESEIVRLQTESEQLIKHNSELENTCKSLTQQVDAATKSQSKKNQALIAELQSQLAEQKIINEEGVELKDKLETQLKEKEAGMTKSKEFQQAELELASLQISQLQEELEYYYLAYQESQTKGITVTSMANQRQRVFSKATAASIRVIGKYADDGYQDIHFVLREVRLGCGKVYSELPVKLANVGGHIAIEFRDATEGQLFQHFEDASDEYGSFLRFFATPPADQVEPQELVYSRMNASERVLVMSTIALLAELLQNQSIECEIQIDASEWRLWRLAAIQLLEATESLPVWLSFDSVALKEEFRTTGYEHLWLSFDNVLVGDNWQERLELKVAASNVKGDVQPFSKEIALEFRTLEDGTPPLLSWPPETADEYGHKLIVQLGDLSSLSDLATPDLNLISHLVNNLSSIIEKVEEQHAVMQRSKNDWISAIELLSKEQQSAVYSDETLSSEAVFSVNEVVSMGSYQHVQFSKPDENTKVKLKARNINPDTFDAELFVELRNGEPDVIYHNTEFYGEDEYGPRVQIPAEALFVEIATERNAEFSWLLEVYNQIRTELESSSEVDELVKRLWVNMFNRKQSIL